MEDESKFYVPQIFYLKVSGGFVSWGAKMPRLWFPHRRRGGWSKSPPQKRKQSKLEKARKRSIAALATVFARLEKPPRGFMTLAFDRDAQDVWSIAECLECFKRFRRYLERSYPKCWFIFVMEWSPTNGFHFHLSGRLGQKPVPCGELRSKWQKITGSSYRRAVHFKAYNPEVHHCYVTKKKIKAARTRKLMRMLGRRSFWGCIHRKQMPLAPIQRLALDEDQMACFRSELERQITNNNGAESSLDRLRTDANRLCFNTPEMLSAAILAALAFDPEEATV